jgi:hypothetical protein
MPPIQLSRNERASLSKLLEHPRQADEIPPDHTEKLINYGLVRKTVFLLHITPLGQMELLRQRFRFFDPLAGSEERYLKERALYTSR